MHYPLYALITLLMNPGLAQGLNRLPSSRTAHKPTPNKLRSPALIDSLFHELAITTPI